MFAAFVGFPQRGLSLGRERELGAEVAIKFPKVMGLWEFLLRIRFGALRGLV